LTLIPAPAEAGQAFPLGEARAFKNCSVSNFSEGASLPQRLSPLGKTEKGVKNNKEVSSGFFYNFDIL
jgi:hypothetical protein